MNNVLISSQQRTARRPIRVGFRAAVTAAVIAPIALTGTAQAATGGPSASLAFASATIKAGAEPVVTYLISDVPSASVIYLQRASGTDPSWQDVGRMAADSATVRAPADEAGDYRYRILVADRGVTVVASPAVALSVTRAARPGRVRRLRGCQAGTSVAGPVRGPADRGGGPAGVGVCRRRSRVYFRFLGDGGGRRGGPTQVAGPARRAAERLNGVK